MNKKFFSLLLLVASMVMSSAFGKALKIYNNNWSKVKNVIVTFAPSMFDQTSDICVNSLRDFESGVSELNNLDRIKLYKVTYEISGETITLDFKGKEVFLPATINLTDITTQSVTYAENAEARTKAEQEAILNRAAIVARNAKNKVVATFVDTKDWIVEKAADIKDATVSAIHNGAQAIADKTAPATEVEATDVKSEIIAENTQAITDETTSNNGEITQDIFIDVTSEAVEEDIA